MPLSTSSLNSVDERVPLRSGVAKSRDSVRVLVAVLSGRVVEWQFAGHRSVPEEEEVRDLPDLTSVELDMDSDMPAPHTEVCHISVRGSMIYYLFVTLRASNPK